ncbi:MAG: hypothetical protein R3B54_05650 [Bdellovibrionota bacterium]
MHLNAVMKARIPIVLFVALCGLDAYVLAADRIEDCTDANETIAAPDVPTPIAFHDQAAHPTELGSYGTVLKPGDNLLEFPSGPYVFLVYNKSGLQGDDVVIVSRRVPIEIELKAESSGEIPEKYLSTHRGLLRQLAKELNISEDEAKKYIVAAGQVFPSAGVVGRQDSKSGAFRGSSDTFEYGRYVLGRYGVKPEENTRLFDIDAAPVNPLTNEKRVPDHQKEADEAAWTMKNVTDPKIGPLRRKLLETREGLYPYFASKEAKEAGFVDGIKLYDFMEAHEAEIVALVPAKYRQDRFYMDVLDATSMLQTWQAESIDVAIHNMQSSYARSLLDPTPVARWTRGWRPDCSSCKPP